MATNSGGAAFRPVNPEMAAAAADFKALRHESAGGVILRLLDILLNDYRIENDTAEPQVVVRNQGRIDVLLKLKQTLERDFPAR